MTEIVSVYVVFADAEEAARIGGKMVEDRLAACVNILGPCASIYRWQDRIEHGAEVPAIFKTTAAKAQMLIDSIGALHSYEVPAAVAWPVTHTSADYRAWVAANSGG